jgi:hypothetical protein
MRLLKAICGRTAEVIKLVEGPEAELSEKDMRKNS